MHNIFNISDVDLKKLENIKKRKQPRCLKIDARKELQDFQNSHTGKNNKNVPAPPPNYTINKSF